MADRDPETLSLSAPAKINLYLHVTARQADGYHQLDSLVAFADVGDTLAAGPADGLSLVLEGRFAGAVPGGEDNLILKAARRLADAAGVKAAAAITLVKDLPPASGIGGGSADAAAALRVLSRLWGVAMDEAALMELALSLGADVPVCLFGRCAQVGGAGERIEAAGPLPPAWLVLANPGVSLATPDVFAARSGPFSGPAPIEGAPADARALARLLEARRNDLTEPACELAPEVGVALAELEALPGALLARMSGSGATCFALFAEAGAAEAAARALSSARPQWWVKAAKLLGGGGPGR